MIWQKSCGRGPARSGEILTSAHQQSISKVHQRAQGLDSVGPLLGCNAPWDAER